MSIEAIASRCMTKDRKGPGGRWAPCPWLVGAQAGRVRPGEPSGCDGDSHAVAIDDRGFYCHRCMRGGGAKTLARLLGDALPADFEPPTPAPKVDKPGKVDVGAAWAALTEQIAGWPDTVRRHLMARGWPEALAARVEAHPDVVGRPAARWAVPPAARALFGVVHADRGLWVALRDATGAARDVVGRWTANRPPDDCDKGLKGKRLWRGVRGEVAGALVFGSIPEMVARTTNGRPVVIVEGEMDYLAMCAVVGDAASVIGAPGTGSWRKVVALVVEHLTRLPTGIAQPTVYAVPDVGDLLDRPEHPQHLGGERRLLDAVLARHDLPWSVGPARTQRAVSLLDVARVCWSPPIMCRSTARRIHPNPLRTRRTVTAIPLGPRPVVDFEDLARSVDREAAWQTIRAGLPVVHDGARAVWRECIEAEIRAACYRLSLRTVIDAMNHRASEKDGAPPEYRPIPAAHMEPVLMHWFREHGARFFNDGQRALVMWRGAMYDVESNAWLGELDRLADLNPGKEGRRLAFKMLGASWHSRRGAVVASPFWAGASEIRVHLQHDLADTVMRIRAGKVDLVDNGTPTAGGRAVVQQAALQQVEAIAWRPDVGPAEAARRLYDRAGRWWTVPPAERVLVAAYLLISLCRHQLRDRPILWLAGESASGKTIASELFVALLYGDRGRVLSNPTLVSLHVQAATLPLLVLDNTENAGPGGKRQRLERMLLNAATGRQARTKGTKDGGHTAQDMAAMMTVTAIEPPTLHELVNRCLMVQHDPAHRDPDFRPGVIDEVQRDRSAILSGMGRMWAELLPRLEGVGRLASLVPTDHPIGRMRETLAVMALVGEALGVWDPRWTRLDAASLLNAWLLTQGERASALQALGDPIMAAFDALVRRYNRVEAQGGAGVMWQPALASDELASTPVFALMPGAVEHQTEQVREAAAAGLAAPAVEVTTLNRDAAETTTRYGHRALVVVGFQGTHAEIYEDLVSTMARKGLRQEFVEAVASPSVLGVRANQCRARWTKARVTDNSPRVYRYTPAGLG